MSPLGDDVRPQDAQYYTEVQTHLTAGWNAGTDYSDDLYGIAGPGLIGSDLDEPDMDAGGFLAETMGAGDLW